MDLEVEFQGKKPFVSEQNMKKILDFEKQHIEKDFLFEKLFYLLAKVYARSLGPMEHLKCGARLNEAMKT